jgi:K+-sensing histidine kinase KdpD
LKEVLLDDNDAPKALLDYIQKNCISSIVVGASTRNALARSSLSLSLSLSLYIYIYIHGKDKLNQTVGVDTYVSTGSSKLMMSRVV